jgi:hypothetical protein
MFVLWRQNHGTAPWDKRKLRNTQMGYVCMYACIYVCMCVGEGGTIRQLSYEYNPQMKDVDTFGRLNVKVLQRK